MLFPYSQESCCVVLQSTALLFNGDSERGEAHFFVWLRKLKQWNTF